MNKQCDCTSYPWSKRCEKYCRNLVFEKSTVNDLVDLFELDYDVAVLIKKNVDIGHVSDNEDYLDRLTPMQKASVISKFNSLSNEAVVWIEQNLGDEKMPPYILT